VLGPGISCGATCSENYTPGTSVTLTTTRNPSFRFHHWSGDCSGTSLSCTVQMSSDRSVTANWVRRYTLTVAGSPSTGGTVIGPGIFCGGDCSGEFDAGTPVKVDAVAAPGFAFAGWSSCPSPSGASCVVTLTSNTGVTANFVQVHTLSIDIVGGPNGTVSGPGWSCSFHCTFEYAAGTIIPLSAAPNLHVAFDGWSGGCSGAGPCQLTITGDVSVSATFVAETHRLTASKSGGGSISGPGWSCATSCTHDYVWGTAVTLVANADPGSSFTAWAGCDSTSGNTCNVTLTADKAVTATFASNTFVLTVGASPGGTITGPGIDCGPDCSESFAAGTPVTLTPTAAPGFEFTGWTGACSGTGDCTVTMNGNRNVGATFGPV
jgi:hypothetical protein